MINTQFTNKKQKIEMYNNIIKKQESVNKLTQIKFNNNAGLDFINKLCTNLDLGNIIKDFLYNEQFAKNNWQNKINLSLSKINKNYYWVPIYYFPYKFNNILNTLLPCTECYINKFISNKPYIYDCITCEMFQLQNGIYMDELLINIDEFIYFENLIRILPKIVLALIQSDTFLAKSALTNVNGIITTKFTKEMLNYNILYNMPLLKKINKN